MPEAVPRLPGRVSGLRGLAGLAEPGAACARGRGRNGAGPGRNPKPRRALFPPQCFPAPCFAFLSLCFSETGSPRTRCGAKDDFELAIFLPPLRAGAGMTDVHRLSQCVPYSSASNMECEHLDLSYRILLFICFF